jgi:hypothetical protein
VRVLEAVPDVCAQDVTLFSLFVAGDGPGGKVLQTSDLMTVTIFGCTLCKSCRCCVHAFKFSEVSHRFCKLPVLLEFKLQPTVYSGAASRLEYLINLRGFWRYPQLFFLVEKGPTALRLLVQTYDIDEDDYFCPFPSNEAPVERNWQGKTEILGEKPVPVPFCPPQIPHGLTWDRIRASAVGGRRLTAILSLSSTSHYLLSSGSSALSEGLIVAQQFKKFLGSCSLPV